jgi:hypothetical protein
MLYHFSEVIFTFYVAYKLHVKSVYTVHTHTFTSEYVPQVYFSLRLCLAGAVLVRNGAKT